MSAGHGVIFDLDGVLLDSAELHRRSWYRLAEEVGAEMSDGFFQETFGLPNARILPRLLGRRLAADETRRLSERKEALYRQEASGRIELFPGAVDLFEALRAHGFRLAVGSSTPRSNMDFLRRELGLDAFVEVTVSSDDVAHGKPDPEVFLQAAARLQLPPQRCVVLEDAPAGIEAAEGAGMLCVAVASTHAADELERLPGTHLVVSSIRELKVEDLERLLEGSQKRRLRSQLPLKPPSP